MLVKLWEKTGISAQQMLDIAELFADIPGTCLLYSGGSFDTSQKSYLFVNPVEIVRIQGPFIKNPWDILKEKIELSGSEIPDWVGFLSYEMGSCSDHEIQHPYQSSETPDVYFQKSATVIVHDNASQTLIYYCRTSICAKDPTDSDRIGTGWEQDKNRIGKIITRDTHPVPIVSAVGGSCPYPVTNVGDVAGNGAIHPPQIPTDLDRIGTGWEQDKNRIEMLTRDTHPVPIVPAVGGSCSYPVNNVGDSSMHLVSDLESEESYINKVNAAKELIYNGDIYQVNISQKITCEGECHPFFIFRNAMTLNPAPFAAYIKQTEFTVVCTSPERFLSKKNGQLETRPIKGTAPRGKTPEEDQLFREHLLNSPKETAELLMITDLMRNDLGKVSLPGTVKTINLGILEAFTNVFHKHAWIVSESQNLHSVDLVRSCFPGGSITGCPKIRAMQVIADLEKEPRGLYTGSIGYFCGNGDFDFNIAIRTMVFVNNKVTVRLGGGIVADSDPVKEYQETLHKGETIFKSLGVSLLQMIDL